MSIDVAHEADVDSLARQCRELVVGEHLGELQFDFRMTDAIGEQHVRQNRCVRQRRGEADAQHAAFAPCRAPRLLARLRRLRQDGAGMFEKGLAGLGQLHAALVAGEQSGA
ncbi:MAG: hypothetical protein H6R12_2539, partial [Proteobacteria bacterium]|nr:hypothetical protein [Pseudomonadota bacterium]